MGHVLHFEEAASLGDVLVVTITADKYITKKRSVSFTEEYRARQVAALEIVDFVAIVNEPSAVRRDRGAAAGRLRQGVRSTRTWCSTRRRTSSARRSSIESYGGRIHFTTGETFSSTKLSHFLQASPEAVQDNPLLRNERVLFRDVSKLQFKLEELKTFLVRAQRAPRLPARRDDRRRMGRHRGHEPVPEVAVRGRAGDGADPADRRDRHHRAAPRRASSSRCDCFTNGSLGDACPPNVTVTPLSREPARQDALRRSGQRVCRSSSRRCSTFPT